MYFSLGVKSVKSKREELNDMEAELYSLRLELLSPSPGW